MKSTKGDKVIDIWFGNIEPSEPESLHDYEPLLDASERARFNQFKIERMSRQYLGVRGRLRMLLAEYTGCRPEEIRFAREKYGKPFLPDHPEIAFNISHSENKLAIAVAEQCLLGVDIEFWKNRVNFPAIVEKCFAQVECQYWHDLPDERKIAVFFDFWTKKESFVKAVGRGIALGLEQCVVSLQEMNCFTSIPESYGPVADWEVFTLNLGEDISGALSVRGREYDISVKYF